MRLMLIVFAANVGAYLFGLAALSIGFGWSTPLHLTYSVGFVFGASVVSVTGAKVALMLNREAQHDG